MIQFSIINITPAQTTEQLSVCVYIHTYILIFISAAEWHVSKCISLGSPPMTLTGTGSTFLPQVLCYASLVVPAQEDEISNGYVYRKKKTTKRDVYNVLVSCTYTHDYYDFLNVFHAANATIDCVEKDVSDNNDAAILFFDRTELSIKYAVYSCYYYQQQLLSIVWQSRSISGKSNRFVVRCNNKMRPR